MKDKKYKTITNFLIITLNILMAIGVIAGAGIIISAAISGVPKVNNSNLILNCIIFFIGTASLIYILYNLKKILKSVLNDGPFTMSNVKCLNKISISCFIITICYLINFICNNLFTKFSFIEIDQTGIHTDTEFLIFFFAGLIVVVLAQVYKQAVEVKEENDFTI